MLHHAHQAIVLEQASHRRQCLAAGSGLGLEAVEVVQGADQQHPVHGAGQLRWYAAEGKAAGCDAVVGEAAHHVGELAGRGDPLGDPVVRGKAEHGPHAVGVVDAVEGAVAAQVIGEDAGIPAAARQRLGHGHARLDLEELQRFLRVAGAVPGRFLGAASGNGLGQGGTAVGCGLRQRRGGQCHCHYCDNQTFS